MKFLNVIVLTVSLLVGYSAAMDDSQRLDVEPAEQTMELSAGVPSQNTRSGTDDVREITEGTSVNTDTDLGKSNDEQLEPDVKSSIVNDVNNISAVTTTGNSSLHEMASEKIPSEKDTEMIEEQMRLENPPVPTARFDKTTGQNEVLKPTTATSRTINADSNIEVGKKLRVLKPDNGPTSDTDDEASVSWKMATTTAATNVKPDDQQPDDTRLKSSNVDVDRPILIDIPDEPKGRDLLPIFPHDTQGEGEELFRQFEKFRHFEKGNHFVPDFYLPTFLEK